MTDAGGAEVSFNAEAESDLMEIWEFILELTGEAGAIEVVDINDRAGLALWILFAELGEESLLGEVVVLHRPVVVEMVLCEISKDGGVYREVCGTALVDAVGGDFDGDAETSVVNHAGKARLQADRFGCCVRGLHGAISFIYRDGANEAVFTELRPHEGIDKKGRSGLAIGSRDAEDGELFRRVPIKRSGKL